MADAPANAASIVSRRSLFRLAWLLLAVSLLIPAPSGFSDPGSIGISLLYAYGRAHAWSQAVPGSTGALSFPQSAILALALYSNIVFLYSLYLRDDIRVSVGWKAILLFALAADAGIALLLPDIAHLPAYWIWLASMAALAVGFVAFGGDAALPRKKTREAPSAIERGEVPAFVWALFACTLFWIAVSAGNNKFPPPDAAAAASGEPLTGYVNDRGHVLTAGEASQLTFALQKFEAETPNQIAVAIYPRAPAGAMDEFTIETAERFPLGRAGLDTGAILFVFMDERAARLEVGYGLEGTLTDADAHRILDAALAPAFARGAYFDGLDATLKAIFANVRDAYKQDRMPGKVTKWRRTLAGERPTKLQKIWRAISEASLAARIGAAFLCALVGSALWESVWHRARLRRAIRRGAGSGSTGSQWGRFMGDIARMVGNLRGRRPFSEGMEQFDVSAIWDSMRLIGWLIGILIPAAGAIIIAGGGEFGGAGALIHW